MSEIVNALAKARERTGNTAAPFMRAAAGRDISSGKPEKTFARNWQAWRLAVCSVLVVVTAAVLLLRLRGDRLNPSEATLAPENTGQPAAHAQLRAAEAQTLSLAPAVRQLAANPSAHPAAPVSVPSLAAPSSAAPRPEIASLVASLPVSAVLPGAEPRFLLDGRVVHVGEKTDGELVFEGVSEGMLIFRDARGARYGRRY
jgi:hypothetical protein